MSDRSSDYALLAVQGPKAFERLGLTRDKKAFTWEMSEIDGVEVMVNRTGYTGEEGCELLAMAEDAGELWDGVLARGVVPCGLGARDCCGSRSATRCWKRHHDGERPDLRRSRTGRARSTRTSRAPACAGIKAEQPERKLVAFVMEDKAILGKECRSPSLGR